MKLELTQAIIKRLTPEQRKELGLEKIDNRPSVPASKQKPDRRNALVKKTQDPTFINPVSVTIQPYCCHRRDTGNTDEKLFIDACVLAGIFRNDTPEEIQRITHLAPIKVKHRVDERTIITIEEI